MKQQKYTSILLCVMTDGVGLGNKILKQCNFRAVNVD